jgi:hypothetical protein
MPAFIYFLLKKLGGGQCLYFSFPTHKRYILSQFNTIAMLCFPYKPYSLEGIEPGSSVPHADAMSTAPRHHGLHVYILCSIIRKNIHRDKNVKEFKGINKKEKSNRRRLLVRKMPERDG